VSGQFKKKVLTPCQILSSRIEGDFAYLKLDGVESIEDTADLIGKEFVIGSEQLIQPGEGAYYPFQIIGLEVFDEQNQYLGKVTDVYINPSQSIYEIKSGKREYFVPATKNFIKKIDLVGKKITIHIIDGMLDEIK
jgi:16S rRNA processing protein RimM